MSDELTALMHPGTWVVVSPPKNYKLVGCKQVFWVKRKSNGLVDIFKARFVAKLYNQREGLDYKKTFSPVVKPAAIKTMLIVTVMQGWPIRQLDVNNTFLHDEFIETAYMSQPPSFKDKSKPHHVYKLRKAIYGLKEVLRACIHL